MNAPEQLHSDQVMRAYFERHGITLPADIRPEGGLFQCAGREFHYKAGVDDHGVTYLGVEPTDTPYGIIGDFWRYPELGAATRTTADVSWLPVQQGGTSGTTRLLPKAAERSIAVATAAAIPRTQPARQNAPEHRKTPSDRRYDLRTADDLAAQLPAPYRVKNVVLREALAAIFGPSGSGKSFAAIDLAFAISDGRDWFGYRVEPCDVLYVCLEGEAGLAQRVKAYQKHHGAGTGKRLKFIAAPFSLLYTGDVDALVSTLKDAAIHDGVIMVDTLNAATPGMDENTSADMGMAIAAVKRIREECGGLVVLLHHPGKDVAKGLRGHSSLHAALDSVIEVSRDGDRRVWKLAKSKDDADGAEHQFRLDVVEVGIDEDGDAITSCLVVPEEIAADTVRRVKLPAGGNQRLIWDALGELLLNSQVFGRGGAPAFRPCVELEAAIEKLRDRLATEPKRRTERTREAITGLVNRGLLKLNEGWLWIA